MNELDRLEAIRSEFNSVILGGRCVICEETDVHKLALLQNYCLPELDIEHESVIVFLCMNHYNNGQVTITEIKEAIENLSAFAWNILW